MPRGDIINFRIAIGKCMKDKKYLSLSQIIEDCKRQQNRIFDRYVEDIEE